MIALLTLRRQKARIGKAGSGPRRATLARQALWPSVCFSLMLTALGAQADEPAKPAEAKPDAAAETRAEPAASRVKVAATVWTILGSGEGSGVDPALTKLKALGQPPFDTFTRKQLLKQEQVELSRGKDTEVALPNGRKLRIQLLAPKADGRYRVSVSINRPGKQDYLPLMTVAAAPGDPFFVAGQRYQGGTLVIGIRVGSAG